MIVMPANASGWFWHSLARETGRIGHLYSPGGERGPWPWLPYALDNGAFALWDASENQFDEDRWLRSRIESWRRLLFWASASTQKPLWAIVPDRPGDWAQTKIKWHLYAKEVVACGFSPAVAVQDGATIEDVRQLQPAPVVICVGGTTEWKWQTAPNWLSAFDRVHLLRCNAPHRLQWLADHGCESCDGTGWNRGNRAQTKGLEEWTRSDPLPRLDALWPFACRSKRKTERHQSTFA